MPLKRAAPPSFWDDEDQIWRARVDAGGSRKHRPCRTRCSGSVMARRSPNTFVNTFAAWMVPSSARTAMARSARPRPRRSTTSLRDPYSPPWRSAGRTSIRRASSATPSTNVPGGRVACSDPMDDLTAFTRLFFFDPDSGRLSAAPELRKKDRVMFARVRITLRVLGLNTHERARRVSACGDCSAMP